jgi:hypothetical protein
MTLADSWRRNYGNYCELKFKKKIENLFIKSGLKKQNKYCYNLYTSKDLVTLD